MTDDRTLTVKQGARNVLLLGLVSLFTDLSTEMVYPLVTIYLSTFATVAVVGVVEGVAEATAFLLKAYSGFVSDKYQNKKPIAFAGYATTIVYKILLFFAGSWVGILFARLIDRIGKGIRTAPRDALVASSGGTELGRAFGLHKTLDMFGSGAGVLLSIGLFAALVGTGGTAADTGAIRTIFLLSIIPAVIGLVALGFVVETKRVRTPGERFTLKGIHLDPRVVGYLVIVLVFAIGYPAEAFLILRARAAGFSIAGSLLLYFLYFMTGSLLAFPLGKLSDRIGRRKLVVPAYLLFGAVFLGFAFATTPGWYYALFVAYGVFTAMVNGAEKAFLAEYAPKAVRGTVLGLYGTAQGVGYLIASIVAGLLWGDGQGTSIPFLLGGGLAILAAGASLVVMVARPHEKPAGA